jgi:anti-sigma factor RsiW
MSQPDDATPTAATPDEPDDAMAAKLYDYAEGTLAEADRPEVEAYLRARGELPAAGATTPAAGQSGARLDLRALRAAAPPPAFTEGVTSTIRQRSAGRFFGRRTLGDRLPLGWLLAIALVVLLVVFAVVWSSPTGSLSLRRPPTKAAPHGSAGDLAPTL